MTRSQRAFAASLGASALITNIACTQANTRQSNSQDAAPATIGTATEEADGTIVLNLRATSAGYAIGDSQLRYPRMHPQYATIKTHVGPIPKGGSVMVKPFPDR